MPRKVKRHKTIIYYVHKLIYNIGACLFIFNRYLIKILLVVGVGAGLFYMCSRVEQYQNDDSIVVAYKHSHPSEMGKGRYQRTGSLGTKVVNGSTSRSHIEKQKKPAPPAKDEWIETTDFSPDMQPFMEEEEPLSFIQSEVRARMREIEQNVLKKREKK